jgi:hypothetical protein
MYVCVCVCVSDLDVYVSNPQQLYMYMYVCVCVCVSDLDVYVSNPQQLYMYVCVCVCVWPRRVCLEPTACLWTTTSRTLVHVHVLLPPFFAFILHWRATCHESESNLALHMCMYILRGDTQVMSCYACMHVRIHACGDNLPFYSLYVICMYLPRYMYVHTQIYVCIYPRICMHKPTYPRTCMHIPTYMCAYTRVYVCTYPDICMHIPAYMYAYTRVHVCIYPDICMYIPVYI